MVRTGTEFKYKEADFEAAGLGKGVLQLKHILNAPEEVDGVGRIFAHAVMPVGAWVGPHKHIGEKEIYYYLKGIGEYYDNGVTVNVAPGDMTQVEPGGCHGLKNIGNSPLEYISIVLFEK